LVDVLQVGRGTGAEEVTPPLGEIAIVHQDDSATVGPEIGAEAYASAAESAEVRFDHFLFQVLGTFDFGVHPFLAFLVLNITT
jgi:hypothetical protein